MASQYLKNIAARRSIYGLGKESTISNARIKEILHETIKHSPTSFNMQAPRTVLLLNKEHDKLWDLATESVKAKLGQEGYNGLKAKLEGYKGGYGTILFFTDRPTLKSFQDKFPYMPFDQWADHSQGMLQVHTWDALELEGMGANLQHYNFIDGFTDSVLKQWDLPKDWDLTAQMVFGRPNAPPKEKTFDQIEGKRLHVFGE